MQINELFTLHILYIYHNCIDNNNINMTLLMYLREVVSERIELAAVP